MSFLYHLVVLFTERMRRNFESLDSDRQVLMKELDRLRKQYDDLIKQLEQTQVIVDQQKVNITIFLMRNIRKLSPLGKYYKFF